MNITTPDINDLPQLLTLWEQQYVYHHHLDPEYYVPSTDSIEYLTRSITKNMPRILVAKENKRLIGFITFEEGKESYFDTAIKNFGIVLELFVLDNYRGKGIGRKLMNEAEQYFVGKGLEFIKVECSTFNLPGLKFYQANGYTNRQSLLFKKIS